MIKDIPQVIQQHERSLRIIARLAEIGSRHADIMATMLALSRESDQLEAESTTAIGELRTVHAAEETLLPDLDDAILPFLKQA